MAQDPNTSQSQADKVEDTMARVDAMLSNFDSTKENMEQSIHKINKAIAKGAKFSPTNSIFLPSSAYSLCFTSCNYRAEADAQHKQETENVNESKEDPGYARLESECKEFFDDQESLAIKVKKLAALVKKSKHFVVFTGAGMCPLSIYSPYSILHINPNINLNFKAFRLQQALQITEVGLTLY